MSKITVLINSYEEQRETFLMSLGSVFSNDVDLQVIVCTVRGDPCLEWGKHFPIDWVVVDKPDIFNQFNSMIPYIKGDFVTYHSCNDLMYSDKLRIESDFLASATNKKIVYTDFDMIDIDNKKTIYKAVPYDYEKHLNRSFVPDCAMVTCDIYRNYCPLDTRWGNNSLWDLFLRVYKKEGNVFHEINTSTWLYIKSPKSNSERRKKDKEKEMLNNQLKIELKKHHTSA